MLTRADESFLSMCIFIKVVPYDNREKGKYYTHGGFINFCNGNYLYAVKDCAATRIYLEERGYVKAQEKKWVHGFNLISLREVLAKEGPGSYNYRKICSYITALGIGVWDKLDKIQSFEDAKKAFDWLYKEDMHLGPHNESKFLKSGEGRYAILEYARENGVDCFKKAEELLAERGIRIDESDLSDKFLKSLEEIPYEDFDELWEIAERKRKERIEKIADQQRPPQY